MGGVAGPAQDGRAAHEGRVNQEGQGGSVAERGHHARLRGCEDAGGMVGPAILAADSAHSPSSQHGLRTSYPVSATRASSGTSAALSRLRPRCLATALASRRAAASRSTATTRDRPTRTTRVLQGTAEAGTSVLSSTTSCAPWRAPLEASQGAIPGPGSTSVPCARTRAARGPGKAPGRGRSMVRPPRSRRWGPDARKGGVKPPAS